MQQWEWLDRNTILKDTHQHHELFDYILGNYKHNKTLLLHCRVVTQSIFASFSSTQEIEWIIHVYEWISEYYITHLSVHDQALISISQLIHFWYPIFIQQQNCLPPNFSTFFNAFVLLQCILAENASIPFYQTIQQYDSLCKNNIVLQEAMTLFYSTDFGALQCVSHHWTGNLIGMKKIQQRHHHRVIDSLLQHWIIQSRTQVWNHIKKAFYTLPLSVATRLLVFNDQKECLQWIQQMNPPVLMEEDEDQGTICMFKIKK